MTGAGDRITRLLPSLVRKPARLTLRGGLLEAARALEEPACGAAAVKNIRWALTKQQPDGWFEDCCLTGAVQIAACWFLLFDITGNRAYAEAARRANTFVRRTIHQDGDVGLRGTVKGSYPVNGHYGRFEALNWAARFAIDANFVELVCKD